MAMAVVAAASPGPLHASAELPAQMRPDGHRVQVDSAIPAYDPAPPLTGDLYIGGGMVYTLVDQWVTIFSKAHPSVRIHTAVWGSTSAFGQMVQGISTSQVSVLTREFMPFEEEFLDMKANNRSKGPGRLGVAVASGGYNSDIPECVPSAVILVNRDNPIKGLTVAQIDAIFSKTRNRGYKEVKTWGDLGLTGDWADKPVHVYMPKMPDGVPNFLRIYPMDYGEFKDSILSLYDNPGILGKDRYALVYSNRGRGNAREQRDPTAKIVALAQTDAGPYSTGTFEDVLKRTYPLSRLVYLYLNTPPGTPPDPVAKEFIRVALSYEGQREVARTALLPLPAADVKASLEKLENSK
jgi:phosphate transport system substrate-binding protein